MNVIVADSAGFCWGVQRAIRLARGAAQDSTRPVVTDGPLIHNRQMLAQLEQESIREAASPADFRDATVVLRAHGVPPEHRQSVTHQAARLVDATCPDVERIQRTIAHHAAAGFATIVFGDNGHAEVIGLLGFATAGGYVVGNREDVDNLPPNLPTVCVVAQSTQAPDAYADICKAILARYPHAVILDTICNATKKRQSELAELAGKVDAFIVVGGRNSANTARLVELAAALKPTFHVESTTDIDALPLHRFNTIGLTAGASTPAFVIDEIKTRLEAWPTQQENTPCPRP